MKPSAFIKRKNGVETPKTCRWCLAACDDLEPLPNDETGQYKLQLLFDCTGFRVDVLPGVPSFLCPKCETRLHKMYTFRWRCNENIALVNGFTEKQTTVKNEADINRDHLGHSAEQTVGTELLIKTEATTPDAANDAIQRSCTVPHVNGAHECCCNQHDDLFEAEENPISIKVENDDVDEQGNFQTNPSELICQDREDSVDYIHSSKLKIHIRTHTDEMPYACKICARAFRSSKLLRKHSVRHNKDHKCPHCPSKFALPSELKDHIRTHTGEKPFVCEVCDKTFTSLNHLGQHKKIHNKDQYHQCPHCPSKFARLSYLNDHIRTHTGEKPFVCEICDQTFRFSSNLGQHKKIHNKDKYHQCPHCPSKLARLSYLNDHIRTHTGEKPFKCRICRKAFYSLSALSWHSKIHKKNQ